MRRKLVGALEYGLTVAVEFGLVAGLQALEGAVADLLSGYNTAASQLPSTLPCRSPIGNGLFSARGLMKQFGVMTGVLT